MADRCREEIVAALDYYVERLLASAGLDRPPVDALRLAREHLRLEVAVDRWQPARGRAQRSGRTRQIYLRPEPSAERRQWIVAHEIGEHLKLDLLEFLEAQPDELHAMTGEALANLFAHRLLVPTRWFAEDARELDYELIPLKERYRTASHEVIAWRMLDLPAPCVMTVVDNSHVSRRRSNAWPVTRQLAPAEQECQQAVNYSGRPRRVEAGGWRVRGWPVHQPHWQREILRSIYEEL